MYVRNTFFSTKEIHCSDLLFSLKVFAGIISCRIHSLFLIYPFIVPPVLLQTISTLMSLLMACRKCIQWFFPIKLNHYWLGMAPHFYEVSRSHTQQRTTVGRTPLNEWSVRRRDLYLTTHTTITTDKHPCPPTCWGFLFTLKNPTASAGLEPANFGTKGQHGTSKPPKPLEHLLYRPLAFLYNHLLQHFTFRL